MIGDQNTGGPAFVLKCMVVFLALLAIGGLLSWLF
jgi:hypothetical protein